MQRIARARSRSAGMAAAGLLASVGLVAVASPAPAGPPGPIQCIQAPCNPPFPGRIPKGLPVPPGYTATDETFLDLFGGVSGYQLLNSWNFGLTDRPSGGYPWSGSGTAPYYGSGTHGWAPNCVSDSIAEEYNLPNRVSQTSTGAAYNASWAAGTGLTISTAPQNASYNGCPYTWVSGALNTYDRQQWPHAGKTKVFVEVSAKMPAAVNGTARSANGLWGSIWMLPASTSVEDNTYELDIMESGYKLNTVDPLRVVTTNLHRPTASQIYYDSGVDLSAGFHTYAVEYDTSNGNVAFYLDGVYRGGYTGIGPRDEMFLLINTHVANAGFPGISGWHTLPSTGTAASMDVAGVRVFEK